MLAKILHYDDIELKAAYGFNNIIKVVFIIGTHTEIITQVFIMLK